jgi:aerobic-type carbon monoxide dehydrogenase small subunit (CoxS/CutS family)
MTQARASAVTVSVAVNGVRYTRDVEPRTLLVYFLREELGLTGTHVGCDTSQCGACTVLLNGRAVKSCTLFAVQADGSQITTIEGLASDGQLHPMQRAFIEHDAFQCGYCTPGQIMSAVKLLAEGHARSDEEIAELMSGNLCRCGAYANIRAAIREVRDAAA